MATAGIRPPQQRRSSETLTRILDAAEELLPAAGSFEALSLNELCATADVSRSSFYIRFKTKDDLVPALCERFNRRAREAVAEVVEASLEPQTVGQVTALILRAHLDFQRSLEILGPKVLDHPRVTAARLETTRLATVAIDELIQRVRGREPRPSETQRLLFLVCVAGSSMRAAITPPQQWVQLFGWDDAGLVEQYVDLCLGYLDLDPSAPVPPSPRPAADAPSGA